MSDYQNTYSNDKSLNFVIPIAIIVLLGIIYIMTQRSGIGFTSFILLGVASLTMFYWFVVLKKIFIIKKTTYKKTDQEVKNWIYDLIKGDDEIVFVAEVPGPEDKIIVRLIENMLYIKGSGNFSKELPIENSSNMQISDFKYRNGVLTLRIKVMES